jgi:predicted AAA+ superfamily ATPase
MIPRQTLSQLQDKLQQAPAVVLLGPRQVGKTTLALEERARGSKPRFTSTLNAPPTG